MVSLRKISPTRHSGTTSMHLFMLAKRYAGSQLSLFSDLRGLVQISREGRKMAILLIANIVKVAPHSLLRTSRLSLILIPDLYETLGVRTSRLVRCEFSDRQKSQPPAVRGNRALQNKCSIRCQFPRCCEGAARNRGHGTFNMEPGTWDMLDNNQSV
jgi:hypothetical protein